MYGDGNCPVVFDTARQITAALPDGASDILVTKIMLGTFGCVPAFDTHFKKGFGVSTFGSRALRKVGEFYKANAESSNGIGSKPWNSIPVMLRSEGTRGRR